MLNYLAYKVINEVAYRCTRKSASAPMLDLFGSLPGRLERIKFDLSHSTTHLGDRLFFFPLLLQLISDGYEVSLSGADRATNLILTALYDLPPLPIYADEFVDLVVIPKPSFLGMKTGRVAKLSVNFSDSRVASPVANALVENFYHFFGLRKSKSTIATVAEVDKTTDEILAVGGRYILFSNYISSGGFRKLVLNEGRLFEKCNQLKSQGFRIIHVGTADDKANDRRSYPFVDVDLRGRLTLSQLPKLVGNQQIEGSVTYDNFLMHLTGLYQKTAYVLFRGRFSRINREHHFLHVNNTFFKRVNQLTYL